MEKKILDIASFLFDDDEFNKLQSYLNNKEYIKVASLIEENKEITDILLSFDNNSYELKKTLDKLCEMEDYFTELYLGKKITK